MNRYTNATLSPATVLSISTGLVLVNVLAESVTGATVIEPNPGLWTAVWSSGTAVGVA